MSWANAHNQLQLIAQIEDRSYIGWDSPSDDILVSAGDILRQLEHAHLPAPTDIYPMPDGLVTIEWQAPPLIWRLEVDGLWTGELMITDGIKDARFKRITWNPATKAVATS